MKQFSYVHEKCLLCSQKLLSQIKLNSDTNVYLTIKMAKQITAISDTFPTFMFALSVDKTSDLPAQITLAR